YCFWDILTAAPGLRIPRRDTATFGGPAAFSKDGKLLAIARTRTLVQLIDVLTGRELASFEQPDPQVIARLAFSPSGTRLAVAAYNQTVQLWDLRALRDELTALNLDWEHPPSPAGQLKSRRGPIHLKVLSTPPEDQMHRNSLDPEEARERGLVWLKSSQWSAALEEFSKAIALSPDDFELRLHRALAYQCASRLSEAKQDLD